MIVLLFSLQTNAQPIPASNPETAIAALTLQASPFYNLEDVVINCDMLQLGTDDDAPLLKTVAWDNGVRYVVTAGWSAVPQAWFWVEDGSGHSQTITLPQYSKQPDIVLGHGQFQSGTSYALAVVYLVEGNPFVQPVYADLYVDVYELINIGTTGFSVNLVTSQQITGSGFTPNIFTEHGNTDGNPHIDMWSDANNTIDGHPSLHELAIVWSEGYLPGSISPPVSPTPGAVYYTHADLFSMGGFAASITGNVTQLNSTSSGMADVACLMDHSDLGSHKMMEIVYGDIPVGGNLYHAEVNLTLSTTSTNLLTNDEPLISRIEAMSQYYGTATSGTKWQVVTSHPRIFGTPPNQIIVWQVYGYDDGANTPHLSDYSAFQGLDCKSPAVAAGIGSVYSSEVGNTQYTMGFYPQDYNGGPLPEVISRAIDVSTAVVGAEYIVNQTATTVNMWDINRIYAVSNSSNSGKNILSALYNGTDIVYKVSANIGAYKQGNPTGIIHNPDKPGIRLYPNPALDDLTITGADNQVYEILDMTGKLMLKGYNKGSTIDIRHLPSGMYVLRLQEENKASQTLKFTKQ